MQFIAEGAYVILALKVGAVGAHTAFGAALDFVSSTPTSHDMLEPAIPLPSWDKENSPFASVIGTNHVPSIAEQKDLKALLVHPQHELSRLEIEIERVQSTLKDLLCVKRKIVDYIGVHKALISPVRQIPPETLAEIFVQCLPTEPSFPVRDLNQAPLILTMICQDWRRVAITTPRLWNSLHIYLPPRLSSDACSRRMAGTMLWLERSGSLPLSISFHGSTNIHGHYSPWNHPEPIPAELTISQENMKSMIHSLMSFSDRFRDIFLSLSSTNFSTFDELSPSLFPALVSLRVRNVDGPVRIEFGQGASQTIPPAQFAPLLPRMPFLRKLEVNQFTVNDKNYHTLPCNWRNITNLVIDDSLTSAEVVAILSETPRIQSISLRVSMGNNLASTAVHLNDLTEMQLSVFPGRAIPTEAAAVAEFFETQIPFLVDCIQCPSLRLLNFTCEWPTLIISKWPFTGLSHTLETLKLNVPLTPTALMDCLSQTPDLINFEFKTRWPKFPLQDSHLSSLTVSPENPIPLWPRIQSIRILSHMPVLDLIHFPGLRIIDSFTPFTSAALTTFVESRSQTLKSCDVFYHSEPQPSFSEAELNTLRNLNRDGLRVRLHYQAKAPHIGQLDSPDIGLTPSSLNSRSGHNLAAMSQARRNRSDMEGVFGTVVIL